MTRIAKRYRCIWTVHDELVICVPEAEAEKAKEFMEACLVATPKWANDRLPLAAEVISSERYEK